MSILLTIRIQVANAFNKAGLTKVDQGILQNARIDRVVAAVVCSILSAAIILISGIVYRRLAKTRPHLKFPSLKVIIENIFKLSDPIPNYWNIGVVESLSHCTVLCALNLAFILIILGLTDSEYPRTTQVYEKSFIYKTVVFEIFNYFGSLIYLSLFKGNFFHSPILQSSSDVFGTEYCYPKGCMTELTIDVVMRIVFTQWMYTAYQFTVPIIQKKLRKKKKFAWKSPKVKQWEKDFALVPPPELFITHEYEEMVLQYALVCCFSVAFPLVPLLALVNNLFEMRCDAKKWTRIYRRPVPQISTSIGPWFQIIVTISVFSTVFNAAIVVFTSELVQQYVYIFKYSAHGDLTGYTVHQLTAYDMSNLTDLPFDPNDYNNTCYFGSYREPTEPFKLTIVGENMMMYKWMLFSLFLIVSTFGRSMIVTFSRSIPENVDIQMRREQYAARQLYLESDSKIRAAQVRKATKVKANPPVDTTKKQD